ncbi:hypothetical protein TRM7557_00319 [Tritonibacter multivorans]|uniref:DUF2061 domain-containing protein n=1 Tax=Tritonibacter multivorans TaxID=928856 RepID=A0A0P1GGI0_9RHOB|nr:DUF2061 domain-containing protein [Tritonibacter multivorans]MDA7419357.1 DUF2061 domain-containing protein [Tritonibacter multivorans]CUH75300.1 hypothetical protein TRM7557_00319 [Tritonibacter multivorans]SFD21443.1 Uncharacterized membrane protein [Tritonibacter multivorans]
METRRRSIVKAVIWNIIGLICMSVVGYIGTGSLSVGGVMAVVNAALGLTMYFIYERIWSGIQWGRAPAFADGGAHV